MTEWGIYRTVFAVMFWNVIGYLTISDFNLLSQFYYTSAAISSILISYSYYNLIKENIVYGKRIKNFEVNKTIKVSSSKIFNDNLNEFLR